MRIWYLGAADPEMAEIEDLLKQYGEQVLYACDKDGKRCHPGNAYAAACPPVYADTVYWVECAPRVHYPMCCQVVKKLDHHRPGDPGFGKPAAEYWQASTLGQVWNELVAIGHLKVQLPASGIPDDRELARCHPSWVQQIVAAADHCLAAAYRGECPDVDPDDLGRWRAESRAAHQKRSVEAVLEDIEAARRILREAVRCPDCAAAGSYCGGHNKACLHGWDQGAYVGLPFADLRGKNIPELPEAACREGIPFLSDMKDPDGRTKVVLQAAGPELVGQFIDGKLVPGLTGVYGDPARGFAGGYQS